MLERESPEVEFTHTSKMWEATAGHRKSMSVPALQAQALAAGVAADMASPLCTSTLRGEERGEGRRQQCVVLHHVVAVVLLFAGCWNLSANVVHPG